ncbi:MAG TPA: septation protein SpoVG family protein [Rhabdochlamydiaceae bacterium]|jgi:stage V sporulation protein G
MKIKKVEIVPIKPHDGLLAFASIEIDDLLYIGSIGVHKRRDGSGYRITFPTRKVGDRQFTICHPTKPDLSKEIESAIISKVEKVFGL